MEWTRRNEEARLNIFVVVVKSDVKAKKKVPNSVFRKSEVTIGYA